MPSFLEYLALFNWSFECRQWNITDKLGQYHTCWCPGFFLIIRSSATIIINCTVSVFQKGRISTTCAISVLRNDRECKYIYIYIFFFKTIQHVTCLKGLQKIPLWMASLTLIFMRSFGTLQPTRLSGFYVQLTEWRSVSNNPFKMGFCFFSHT